MKLFTTKQIAAIDRFTVENEPITHINLMERAAMQITNWLLHKFSNEQKMVFFAGHGNNGGDALAIARQLADLDFICEVYLLNLQKEFLRREGASFVSVISSSEYGGDSFSCT